MHFISMMLVKLPWTLAFVMHMVLKKIVLKMRMRTIRRIIIIATTPTDYSVCINLTALRNLFLTLKPPEPSMLGYIEYSLKDIWWFKG